MMTFNLYVVECLFFPNCLTKYTLTRIVEAHH